MNGFKNVGIIITVEKAGEGLHPDKDIATQIEGNYKDPFNSLPEAED